MDKYVLAATFRGNETVAFGLVKKFYCAIPAHEKKAPTLITVHQEYASRKDLRQGGSKSADSVLLFDGRSRKLEHLHVGGSVD